jgi:hypothetical protein
MKFFKHISVAIIFGLLAIVYILGCKPKTTDGPANTTPAYIGTYLGRDSTVTYNQGSIVNTSVKNNNFEIVESKVQGKNVYFLNFQDIDSVKANFLNGTFAIFTSSALPIVNCIGTFASGSITYELEFQNTTTVKVFGKYYKL